MYPSKKLYTAVTSLLMIVLGNGLCALSMKLFLIPAGLMSTGATGIALAVHEITGVDLSGFILVFNIAALLVGLLLLGKKFAATTVLSSFLFPMWLALFDHTMGDIIITHDPLLNTIYAGIGVGAALGLVMRQGSSTGGMDVAPLILNRYFRVPVSIGLYLFDFLVLAVQMPFHDWEDLLYGLILLMVTSVALDKVLLLGTAKTEIKIISNHADAICSEIMSGLERGVTVLYGRGGYSQNDKEILLSVVSNYEVRKIERIAHLIDPECFMIITKVKEVWGEGFSSYYHKHP